MIYCIDPTADEPIMLLNKHIGYDDADGMGVDGGLFQQELLQLDTMGKKRILVYINSPGGVVTDGYSIYSAILKSKTPVDTYAQGAAASIAGVIFQAGRKRVMTDYAWLMYHNPFGGDNSDMLKTMKASIITMVSQRCGTNESEVASMMNRTSFILAEEALSMNLCDSIEASVGENTKYLKKISNSVEFYKECNLVLNKVINQKQIIMTKVTNRLSLTDAATEESIVLAIDELENRAAKAETDLSEVLNKVAKDDEVLAALKAELDAANKAYEDCKSKLEAVAENSLKAEEDAKIDKATNMVDGYAKAGRIKNEEEVKAVWINLAKNDFDSAKNMLEALPLNKEAVKVDAVVNKVTTANDLPTSAMGLAIKNKLRREGRI